MSTNGRDKDLAYADPSARPTTFGEIAKVVHQRQRAREGASVPEPAREEPKEAPAPSGRSPEARFAQPTVPVRTLPTRDETRHNLSVVEEHGPALRDLLDAVFHALDGRREDLEQALGIVDQIAKYVEDWQGDARAQREARRNLMQFGLELLGDVEEQRVKRAIAHFIRLGLRIGFLRHAPNRARHFRTFEFDLYDPAQGRFIKQNFMPADPQDGQMILQIREVIEDAEEGQDKARKRERKEFTHGTISLERALEEGDGITTITIPAEGRVGRNEPLPGGIAKVAIRKGKVFPVEGTRGIRNMMGRWAEDTKVWIPVEMLHEDDLHMPEYVRDRTLWFELRTFHAMLRRGMRVREAIQAHRDLKAGMRETADLRPREWLTEGKQGSVFLALRHSWKLDGRDLPPASFLFVRNEEGKIRVEACDMPDWQFFVERFSEPLESGQNFEGLPDPLGPILRHFLTIFGPKH